MKFFSDLISVAFIAGSALAETIELAYPTTGTTITRGKTLTVEVQRPLAPMGCYELGIGLTITSCATALSCPHPEAGPLGSVLYTGPFNPTAHQQGGYYQNFTVTIPDTDFLATGPGLFVLTHACLLGAGPYPLMESRSVDVTIV
ncbi:hypothetical protein CONPUDRAFT_158509 [Coniophora puteana RWD-64-598 SS2]|uniref:Phosphatidylglycerol/phosphatidylinositol transfer protein n=1 Tax=Coniophora puteana (strain RWD-64-598) TaxID=741705 RepID=A0A5M3MCX5_CONPW|nr:uncharacterized protein CONPUDRAFT_158509 [Coniophora puteana RWD-64-598 SS2]EIW76491.1 hypothetical protein CONPUDRAFT_158509 [Coniophora puteana RWD-64-598 SS2]